MRKATTWILGAFFIVFFATGAQADEIRRGSGIIDQVNAGTRTITVNSQEYSVPLDCKITRESGSITPLAKLRGMREAGNGLVPSSELDYVRFEAIKKPGGWAMVKITVLDEIPE
jgi:hypothetical protein